MPSINEIDSSKDLILIGVIFTAWESEGNIQS